MKINSNAIINHRVKLTVIGQRILNLDHRILISTAQQQIHNLVVCQADGRHAIDLMNAIAWR